MLLFMLVPVLNCDTDLAIVNENAPDIDRALSSAEDMEALIAGTFAIKLCGRRIDVSSW